MRDTAYVSVSTRASSALSPVFGYVQRRAAFSLGIDPFHRDFVAGMETVARRAGGAVLLQIVADLDEELACSRRWALSGDEVAGVVISDVLHDDPRPALLAELGLPTVVLGHYDGADFSSVAVDDAGAMRDAVRHLVALGHRRIARVTGPSALRHTRVRGAAFEQALAAAGDEVEGVSGVTVEGDYSTESGRTATVLLLEGSGAAAGAAAGGTAGAAAGAADRAPRDQPTAIVYDNDAMAVGGLEAASSLGVDVPGRLSLLAWDDSALCQLAAPPLSVVSRDVPALGEEAADALLASLRGGAPVVVHATDWRIVVRGTTGAPAA